MKSNSIDDLRTHLFDTLAALKDPEKPMDLDRAKDTRDGYEKARVNQEMAERIFRILPRDAAPAVAVPSVPDSNPVQWMEDENDNIIVPRGLLGAACSAIEKQRPAEKVVAALRHYTMNARTVTSQALLQFAINAVAVPLEWRDTLRECAEDLAIELDERYSAREPYPSERRKYENEMRPVYRARTLLQSTAPAVAVHPFCSQCGGQGVVQVMSSNRPDAYEIDADCPHCKGECVAPAATDKPAVAVPSVPTGWQPIDTAPKDGTDILLFTGVQTCIACYIQHDIEWWHIDDNKHGPFPLRGPSPTHWMPLPAPPMMQSTPAASARKDAKP